MHAGVWALAWCAWKRRIHINLHGKQGNKVACNIELEDINFCLGTCNMGLWPCIQKWSPIKFSRYHLSDKILEQSLVFTKWDYSCMGQSQQVFCKKMHLDVPCNARILLVLLQKTKLVMMVCLPSVVCDH